jgi:phosphoribosylformylglycinamidine synthase PurS subunit
MKEFLVRGGGRTQAGAARSPGPSGRARSGGTGLKNVSQTRVGKCITFRLKAISASQARQRVTEIAQKFLANPVIERFSVEVEEL